MSEVMFPVFKDESGWTAPVAGRQSAGTSAAEAAAGDSFRDLVTAQQAAAPTAPAQVRQQTYVFKDENAAFDTTPPDSATATAERRDGVTLFAEGNEPTLWDLLDFVNPLQHIPVVNTLYREISGDKIGAVPKLAGSFAVGGPVGVGIAMASLAVEDATGKDFGEHVLALFQEDDAPAGGATQYAQAETAPAPQAQVEPAKTVDTPAAATAAETPAIAPKTAAVAAEPAAHVGDSRFRPVPPRGTMAVPTQIKPPSGPKVSPTATPAAVRTVQTPAAATTTAPSADQGNEWFVNRFTDAMNKYDQARKLAPRDGQPL